MTQRVQEASLYLMALDAPALGPEVGSGMEYPLLLPRPRVDHARGGDAPLLVRTIEAGCSRGAACVSPTCQRSSTPSMGAYLGAEGGAEGAGPEARGSSSLP